MKNIYFYLSAFIIHFLISCVVASFAGIYAVIISQLLLFLFFGYVMIHRREKEKIAVFSLRNAIFYSFAFAGVMLAIFPLRFLIEAAAPALCVKFNIIAAFGPTGFGIKTLLYLLTYAAAMSFMLQTALKEAREYGLAARILLCGALFSLFSLNLPCMLSNFVIGGFLGFLSTRGPNILISLLYIIFYRSLLFVIDLYCFQVEKTYGEMMSCLDIFGMFLLFTGIAVFLFYFSDRFAQKMKVKKSAATTILVIISSLLLITIGCAVTQYANMI